MPATLATKKPESGEKNTYKLPRGEPLRRRMVEVFREQRRRIDHFVRTGRKDSSFDAERHGVFAQLVAKHHPTGPLPTAWPNWHDFGLGALDLAERMTPLISATWDAAGGKFLSRIGLDPDKWDVTNPHLARMIDESALAFCDSTNRTTSLSLDRALERTREELHKGVVQEGESIEVLTRRVNAIFDGAEKWRARSIAQTETSRAVHAAQEQAAVQSGVVTGWEWLLSGDACRMCIAIAARARFVRLGHAFAVIGENPTYSQVKFPPAHPHCNCTVVEVLDTDEQPAWSDTLHQPAPATDEEHAAVAAITQAWDEATLNPRPSKPKPAAKPAAARKPKPTVRAKPAKPTALDMAGASNQELRDTQASMSADWRAKLTPEQETAFRIYTSNAFTQVNGYLRNPDFLAGEAEARERVTKNVKRMDAALSTARLDRTRILYRGISDLRKFGLSEATIGDADIDDTGYLSMSLDPMAARGFIEKGGALLRIRAPKGARGASMADLTNLPDENEVLFARGSKLRVTGSHRDETGELIIDAELVQGRAKPAPLPTDGEKSATAIGRAESKFGWQPGDVTITHRKRKKSAAS